MSIASAKSARKHRLIGRFLLLGVCVTGLPALLAAFEEESDSSKKDSPEQEVVIKREVLKLTDPRTYRVSMHLDPVKSVDLTAPVSGIIRTISAKAGQKLKSQSEAMRFDDSRSALVLKRARAKVQSAQIEKKIAQAKNDTDLAALADSHLEAAQADFDIAQLEAEQLVVRAPFNCEIQRIVAVEGQFVRAGDKLAIAIDASRLQVEVPVERSAAAVNSTIDIKVEETQVKAKVESVIALADVFDPLRELTISPASANVTIDNAAGKFFAGQTVYSDLIPLAPVALVPSICVSNVADASGNRKVQVLRDNVIRDLVVRILAKVGSESVFVSGRFNEGDEVIVSSSRELTDGTPLRALAAGSNSAAGGGKSPASRNDGKSTSGGKKPPVGF